MGWRGASSRHGRPSRQGRDQPGWSIPFQAGGAVIVPGRNRTLLPGLVDSHTHSAAAEASALSLQFGVTTELDLFSPPSATRQKEQQLTGVVGMADVFTASYLATVADGHPTQLGFELPTIESPDESAAWVGERLDEGADVIKIVIDGQGGRPTLSLETASAITEAAHEAGLRVIAHAERLVDYRTAFLSGVDGLAHAASTIDLPDDLVQEMAAAGVFVISTVGLYLPVREKTVLQDETVTERLPGWARDGLAMEDLESRVRADQAAANVALLHGAGVTVLAGTDAGNPGTAFGASLILELEALVARSGLTPVEALQSATSVPARTLGLLDRGMVQEGLRADVVLVEGNPTADISALRRLINVWKLGVPLKPL